MPVACSAAGAHYLAVGVISAPEYVHRRAVLRATWMGLDGGVDVCANFVVRARHVPMHMDSLLHAEATAHGNDILRVDVPWNETRMRGPILTLAAWVRHASLHFPMARYVAKVDDDSYLHAPGLANMLRSSVEHAAPLAHTYMGTLTWYSWFANKWDRCGFGWTWQGSMGMGHNCRNNTWASQRCVDGCGPASGPFPFAAGYLIILSAPLATAIASSPALDEEMRRLSSASVLHTHKGYRHTQIFEDVWLGSFVHRFISRPSRLAPAPPIAYVQLFRSESVVDLDQTQWASTVRPSALLVHIRSKEPRIFLAVHAFLANASACRARVRTLRCSSGCDAFGVPPADQSARLCLPTGSNVAAPSVHCRLAVEKPSTLLEARAREACMPQNLQPAVKAALTRVQAKEILRRSRAFVEGRNGGGFKMVVAGTQRRRLAETPSGIASPALAVRRGRGGAGGGGRGARGWRAHGSQLQALVQVANLDESGALVIPHHLQLVLEVGANTRNTLDHELLPHEPDTFLVSFEPLLDKYATLLARHSRPDTRSPLGHHHARALVLPFAVSAEANSIKEFKISGSTDGCASLLDPVSSYYSTSCTNLSGIAERRAVPSVSLEHVLSTWLAKRDIALAKIDAQGLDVGVVRSAGAHLNRLRAVQLEVVRDRPPLKCTPQYAAEPGRPSEAKCNALVAAMAEMGFAPYATNCYVHKFKEAGGCEAEMMFVRPGFDMGLVRRFCMSQRPHSCGPGAWSVPADRRSWDPATKVWAAAIEKDWPDYMLPNGQLINPYEPAGRARGARGGGRGRGRGRARGGRRRLSGGAGGGDV